MLCCQDEKIFSFVIIFDDAVPWRKRAIFL